jgi:hypothetical protein
VRSIDQRVRKRSDDLGVDQLYAALIGVAVGALGSHLLTQQRERAAERRRARNICRLLFRDLFQIHLTIYSATYKGGKWPPHEDEPIKLRIENWRRLGPDFTMVCRDEELWESVALAFEEAEYIDEQDEVERHRVKLALNRIEDAVEQTAKVNRSWSNKVRNRIQSKRRAQDDED